MPASKESINSAENPREFEDLLLELGGSKNQISGTAANLILQALQSHDPDAALQKIKRFRGLLSLRMEAGGSIYSQGEDVWKEWSKENLELICFLDGIRHGLRVAQQRMEGLITRENQE